ncbi:hypothetical protein [Streptomyces sp. C8S0]|uniref:hypothetical protein n=1 Tax=Streptomyces sp. C8S0 TaxID=2585716 RepID=UPI001D045781|nr:hypothetical protein [Streptomyces sp. C8S0]
MQFSAAIWSAQCSRVRSTARMVSRMRMDRGRGFADAGAVAGAALGTPSCSMAWR